jgi:glycosyltransferase involved in cell wall biosynthesis
MIALRVFAAYDLLRRPPSKRAQPRIPDAELPVYTILVPLYREANMLASLVRALARLDYPGAKIDIELILEAVNVETIAVARSLDLPGNIEIVVVPDLQPRTKPKALNYALPLARGEYLVIYDAEDRPERDQLRKAIAVFQEGPPNLACLQAKLNLYNASDNSTHEGPQQLCSRSLGDSRPNPHPRLFQRAPKNPQIQSGLPFPARFPLGKRHAQHRFRRRRESEWSSRRSRRELPCPRARWASFTYR